MDCIAKGREADELMNGRDEEKKMLTVIYGDATLGVKGAVDGKAFHYIFSYSTGGLESLVTEGKEWLYRTPRPTFWRALTDNDRGNRFHLKSGMWLSADMFLPCIKTEVAIDGKEIIFPCAPQNNKCSDNETATSVRITFTYETITVPSTTVKVSYEVNAEGVMKVTACYHGKEGLPSLPVFGMRFIMPTCADKFVYSGLSGETYPDRKAGGISGVYEVEGLPVTPYLVPQECGMHMDTDWVEIYRTSESDNRKKEKKQTGLRVEANQELFAFSCLPYTAQELENATHQEELPPARRTVLCICGKVRGVGGIDSWGADVEEAYRIDATKDITFSFVINPRV